MARPLRFSNFATICKFMHISLFLILYVNYCNAVGFGRIPGEYCSKRSPTCCVNRDDDCTVSILDDHLCYCDIFCDRGPDSNDCCPDFKAVCQGVVEQQHVGAGCMHDGAELGEGARIRKNCQECSCKNGQWQCDNQGCLIQEDILETVRNGRFTWQARNYSQFWGRTLDDGVKFRLGTLLPERSVANMNEILIKPRELPERFDAREKWPLLIHGIRDQGDCASSWSFSTTSTAADRLAIVSEGAVNSSLSAQQLLSCNQHRQKGCEGGYLDRAWWVVSEACYSYTSGQTQQPGDCAFPKQYYLSGKPLTCPNTSTTDSAIYKTTPPYRVSNREEDIMTEMITNGPVQATFLVHEDFFIYSGGVYKHTELARDKGVQYTAHGYHSVRLLGWGEDETTGRPVKYWLAANSWGRDWGEDGFFRILRGENHCDIESFIIGAWGKDQKRRKKRFKIRKHRTHRNRHYRRHVKA